MKSAGLDWGWRSVVRPSVCLTDRPSARPSDRPSVRPPARPSVRLACRSVVRLMSLPGLPAFLGPVGFDRRCVHATPVCCCCWCCCCGCGCGGGGGSAAAASTAGFAGREQYLMNQASWLISALTAPPPPALSSPQSTVASCVCLAVAGGDRPQPASPDACAIR